jgi:hypothetical protein
MNQHVSASGFVTVVRQLCHPKAPYCPFSFQSQNGKGVWSARFIKASNHLTIFYSNAELFDTRLLEYEARCVTGLQYVLEVSQRLMISVLQCNEISLSWTRRVFRLPPVPPVLHLPSKPHKLQSMTPTSTRWKVSVVRPTLESSWIRTATTLRSLTANQRHSQRHPS